MTPSRPRFDVLLPFDVLAVAKNVERLTAAVTELANAGEAFPEILRPKIEVRIVWPDGSSHTVETKGPK